MHRLNWILILSLVVLCVVSAIPLKLDEKDADAEELYFQERDLVELRRMLDYFRTVFGPQTTHSRGELETFSMKEYERGSKNSESDQYKSQTMKNNCNYSEKYQVEKEHEDINIGINVVVNQPYVPCGVCESQVPEPTCTSPPPSHPPSSPPPSSPTPSHPPSSPPPSHPPSSPPPSSPTPSSPPPSSPTPSSPTPSPPPSSPTPSPPPSSPPPTHPSPTPTWY